jgi:hypothetical protein
VQPSGPAEPPLLRWRASDHEMFGTARDSRYVQRSGGAHLPEPYGSVPPARTATLEGQGVRDNTGKRHRRFWPFKPNGRKTQPRVMDPDVQPDVEFWSRRRRTN